MKLILCDSHHQEEAIPESLKNILLVMGDGGYLAPPTKDPSKEKIWTETRKRLDRFLPDLFTEIFPEASYQNHQHPSSASKEAPVSAATSQEVNPPVGADPSDVHQNGNKMEEKAQQELSRSRMDANTRGEEAASTTNTQVAEASPDDVD